MKSTQNRAVIKVEAGNIGWIIIGWIIIGWKIEWIIAMDSVWPFGAQQRNEFEDCKPCMRIEDIISQEFRFIECKIKKWRVWDHRIMRLYQWNMKWRDMRDTPEKQRRAWDTGSYSPRHLQGMWRNWNLGPSPTNSSVGTTLGRVNVFGRPSPEFLWSDLSSEANITYVKHTFKVTGACDAWEYVFNCKFWGSQFNSTLESSAYKSPGQWASSLSVIGWGEHFVAVRDPLIRLEAKTQ